MLIWQKNADFRISEMWRSVVSAEHNFTVIPSLSRDLHCVTPVGVEILRLRFASLRMTRAFMDVEGGT